MDIQLISNKNIPLLYAPDGEAFSIGTVFYEPVISIHSVQIVSWTIADCETASHRNGVVYGFVSELGQLRDCGLGVPMFVTQVEALEWANGQLHDLFHMTSEEIDAQGSTARED